MKNFFSDNSFDWVWRVCVAQIFNTALFFLSLVSLYLPETGSIRPYFIVMLIYYWTTHRPSLLPPVFIFFIGLVYDFALSFPIGFHSALFLLMQWVLHKQRLFFMGQTYLVSWIGFCLTCFIVLSIEWAFFSIYSQSYINLIPLFQSLVLTAFLFPLIAILFKQIQKILPVSNQALN